MRLATPAVVLVSALLLAGCGDDGPADGGTTGSDRETSTATPTSTPTEDATEDATDDDPSEDDSDDEPSLEDLLGDTEVTLDVGDCWGLEDEVQLDPIPCDGPHIYEVVAIIEEWDHEPYEGGFDARAAGEDALRDACDAASAGYFGGVVPEGVTIAYDEPEFMGRRDIVVCSAHGDMDTEVFREEVTSSYEDRGMR
jgi:hypothetical protein